MKEGIVFTPNLDHLVKLQKDKEFYNLFDEFFGVKRHILIEELKEEI
jgi:hypothetical protein